jgi:hypothetical protein
MANGTSSAQCKHNSDVCTPCGCLVVLRGTWLWGLCRDRVPILQWQPQRYRPPRTKLVQAWPHWVHIHPAHTARYKQCQCMSASARARKRLGQHSAAHPRGHVASQDGNRTARQGKRGTQGTQPSMQQLGESNHAHMKGGAYLVCGSRRRLSAACSWRTGAPERHATTPNQENTQDGGRHLSQAGVASSVLRICTAAANSTRNRP